MRYSSCATTVTDAYRAGIAVGEALAGLSPEVILLFASVSFENGFAAFHDGLYDGLGTTDVLIIGGTGDGIYESSLACHYGVCALGITSDGNVRWSSAVEMSVASDSELAGKKCAESALSRLGAEPGWAFAIADGVKADGTRIVEGIRSVLSIPFVGGLSGDDRKFTRSRIFFNGREIEDGVAILLAAGALPFSMSSGSGWVPFGASGVVKESRANTIYRIDGLTAQQFIQEQTGKPVVEADLGMVPFAHYRNDDGHFSLRALSRFDATDGSVSTFGSIAAGSMVRVCGATIEQVLEGVETALSPLFRPGFVPGAAVVVSCAARKWLLDERGREEVSRVKALLGDRIPLVGFPSFGEFGPYCLPQGGYTETLFHNVTFVICILGA